MRVLGRLYLGFMNGFVCVFSYGSVSVVLLLRGGRLSRVWWIWFVWCGILLFVCVSVLFCLCCVVFCCVKFGICLWWVVFVVVVFVDVFRVGTVCV